MPTDASTPSLDELPFELIKIIVDMAWQSSMNGSDRGTPWVADTLMMLSWTSRRLRAAALPRIWNWVEIQTVRELGLLAQVLRGAPYIARHVLSFQLELPMDNECFLMRAAAYATEDKSLFDLLFCDRLQMWEDLRRSYGCQVNFTQVRPFGTRAFFVVEGTEYVAPGHFEPSDNDGEPLSHGHIGGKGPDGEGEDKRIKNSQQLVECLFETVSQLTSLERFAWLTDLPMPVQVIDALANFKHLIDLDLSWKKCAFAVYDLSLWKLSGNLEGFCISYYSEQDMYSDLDIDEQDEATIMSVEVPFPSSGGGCCAWWEGEEAANATSDSQQRNELNIAVASRTIATAARGNRLRELYCPASVQAPFAARTLLPYWVQIEDWRQSDCGAQAWLEAASSVRPLLAHASLWLGTSSSSEPRPSRLLSTEEVQSLRSHFEQVGLPKPSWATARPWPVERYLPWLEDADLAEQVADKWNEVVERGGSDCRTCLCDVCWGHQT